MNTKNLRKRDNPTVWKYQHGSLMFSTGEDFGLKNRQICTSDIIEHWTAVLKRAEKHNKQLEEI